MITIRLTGIRWYKASARRSVMGREVKLCIVDFVRQVYVEAHIRTSCALRLDVDFQNGTNCEDSTSTILRATRETR